MRPTWSRTGHFDMTPTSRFVIYVIATSLLYLSLASAASFVPDTTGLYDRPGEPKYVVEYYTKYVKPEDATSTLTSLQSEPSFVGLEHVAVKSKSGNDMYCFLPNDVPTSQSSPAPAAMDVAPLLQPLTTTCIYRLEGWWTYEFCYGKHIKQFHKNAEGVTEAEFSLGLASGAAPVQEKEYYSETYTGGTPCDVRELRRQSEIRFRCSEGDVSLIVDLKEPSTCQYLIDIETPLLCKHPKYRKKIDVAFPIRCVEFVPADDAVVATHPQLRRVVTPNKEKNLVIAQSATLDSKKESGPRQGSTKSSGGSFKLSSDTVAVQLSADGEINAEVEYMVEGQQELVQKTIDALQSDPAFQEKLRRATQGDTGPLLEQLQNDLKFADVDIVTGEEAEELLDAEWLEVYDDDDEDDDEEDNDEDTFESIEHHQQHQRKAPKKPGKD